MASGIVRPATGGPVIGLDVGTSAVKALLVDADQSVLAQTDARLTTRQPQPGWSEQDPADWWTVVQQALGSLRRAAPAAFGAVRAIGLSGQMHGSVLLDSADQVIRPAILWNDGRAVDESTLLAGRVPDIGRIAGVVPMPGLTAPKLLWLSRHEPDSLARLARILLPKDFIRLQLTGSVATDRSDAAGSLWLDQASRTWSAVIAEASGIDPAVLPPLAEGTDAAGTLRPAVANRLGLDPATLVAVGGGDAAVGGIGIGAVNDGDAYLSLGTSAQFFVTTDAYRPAPETLLHSFAHALPGRWFQMAAMLNGASVLAWAARLMNESDLDRLLARVASETSGPSRVLVLPYLAGERTPHNDPNARAVVFGADPATDAPTVIRAVLEGVAYTFADALDCLRSAGTSVSEAAMIGGGARSGLWMQILADVLGLPVYRYGGGELGPAFGAARLARLAVGDEPIAAVATKPPVRDRAEPDPTRQAAYAEGHARFRRLYRALAPEFADMGTDGGAA